MREKRTAHRRPKRLLVRFGEEGLDRTGFTSDVSTSGMFVVSSTLPPLDSQLHCQLFFGETDFAYFEGRVARHRLVPVELRAIAKAGFGVAFLTPGQLLADVLRRPGERSAEIGPRFRIDVPSHEALLALWNRELQSGAVFITSEQHLNRNDLAEIELALAFAPGNPPLRFAARVREVLQVPGRPAGIGFEFIDRSALVAQIRSLLGR